MLRSTTFLSISLGRQNTRQRRASCHHYDNTGESGANWELRKKRGAREGYMDELLAGDRSSFLQRSKSGAGGHRERRLPIKPAQQ